jgi:hypothetical protein
MGVLNAPGVQRRHEAHADGFVRYRTIVGFLPNKINELLAQILISMRNK